MEVVEAARGWWQAVLVRLFSVFGQCRQCRQWMQYEVRRLADGQSWCRACMLAYNAHQRTVEGSHRICVQCAERFTTSVSSVPIQDDYEAEPREDRDVCEKCHAASWAVVSASRELIQYTHVSLEEDL